MRRLTLDPDEFRRTVKKYIRKFNDDVVIADGNVQLGSNTVKVKDFKDLIKFSQNLCKPIVYTEGDKSGLFYIICDDVIYNFEVLR